MRSRAPLELPESVSEAQMCFAKCLPGLLGWFLLGCPHVRRLSLKGVLMEVLDCCHTSDSNSRALAFGFRMCCVVAKPGLVASLNSWVSDFNFPLHQSDPFNNNVPNKVVNP